MLFDRKITFHISFHLLVVGRLKLEELGGVVDEGEDDDADDVTPSLAHRPLHSNTCQTNEYKMQNTKYRNTKKKYKIQHREV